MPADDNYELQGNDDNYDVEGHGADENYELQGNDDNYDVEGHGGDDNYEKKGNDDNYDVEGHSGDDNYKLLKKDDSDTTTTSRATAWTTRTPAARTTTRSSSTPTTTRSSPTQLVTTPVRKAAQAAFRRSGAIRRGGSARAPLRRDERSATPPRSRARRAATWHAAEQPLERPQERERRVPVVLGQRVDGRRQPGEIVRVSPERPSTSPARRARWSSVSAIAACVANSPSNSMSASPKRASSSRSSTWSTPSASSSCSSGTLISRFGT